MAVQNEFEVLREAEEMTNNSLGLKLWSQKQKPRVKMKTKQKLMTENILKLM